jgi:UDP-4-amino-4,6-dideoxy-N-acetyl-beta-L-altrosamine transaminase
MIPYGRQNLDDQDIDAVVRTLRSDWLTQGPAVGEFEQAVSAQTGAVHAVAVNSATSALHLACLALELGPGDTLWTSPNTYVASANCARYCGAQVDFVDIDPRTYNISLAGLAEKLAQAERLGTLPKVVVPVHFAGQSCDMPEIQRLARRYGFKVIEDASHAIGGSYRGSAIGNCLYSDITVFSFHPVKIITTAEGGMALTNSPELDARLRSLRSHGVTRDPSKMQGVAHGPWYYEQIDLGFNYRMTDVQAALGLSQHRRLKEFVTRRRQIARSYDELLAGLPLVLPFQHPDSASAFHLYVIQVDPDGCDIGRRTVFERLRAEDIGVSVHYIPVYTQPYYRRLGFRAGACPTAESYYSHAMSLPMYVGLTDDDIQDVVNALRKSLS